MFGFILEHLNVLNLIIAFLTLLATIYGILYTRHFNRRHIIVSDGAIDCGGRFPLVSFLITNPSSVPVTIKGITLTDTENKVVIPINYTPPSIPYEIPQPADPLCTPCVLIPYGNVEPSYYIRKPCNRLNITVICQERIFRFKKQQTFSLHLSDITD